jgi:hypothetical protein
MEKQSNKTWTAWTHQELFIQWHSVTSQNTYVFSYITLTTSNLIAVLPHDMFVLNHIFFSFEMTGKKVVYHIPPSSGTGKLQQTWPSHTEVSSEFFLSHFTYEINYCPTYDN